MEITYEPGPTGLVDPDVNLDGLLVRVRMSIAGLRGKRKREAIESIGRTLAAEMGVA